MPYKDPPFTIGIEEEYLLVDPDTRDLAADPPPEILREAEKRVGERVTPEFLRSQIEVGTRVCGSVAEVRKDLGDLRRCIRDVAADHGLAMIAASTHPFADWDAQRHTDKDRYNILARDLQAVARRLLICGMHVHVGIDNDEMRIDLLNQISYFLPHLLALTSSSPFWRGEDTGLKSYRIAVWNELPRTGIPPQFTSFTDYRQLVDALTGPGVIEDATKLWWDVRPSARFPTIEMRMTDVCTRIDDAVCVAALYLCLLRMLWRLRRTNQSWRLYKPILINENRWRAQRYGFDEGLIDFGKGEIGAYPGLLEEVIELTAEDARFFDCVAEVEHAREILKRGTSAHRQLTIYHAALESGRDRREALRDVVDMLIEESGIGL